ncbi:NucA/NucB deoxyribonuclease domain-containing protein, partial [Streptomyces anulatus]|uniref:NucA/NucB deoxyribonuclease domain-containing protein n=1 Tax=Streptomyces anulatus TaxID=1892 RepID=UPI003440EC02
AQQGTEKRQRCTLTFTTWASSDISRESKTWDKPKALIRCDTASYISQGHAKNGGCVFQGIAPSIVVGYGDGWDEQTNHLETARNQPSQTIPRMPFKVIPGFDKNNMIERCANNRVCGKNGLNRAWARRACREEWGWAYSQRYAPLPNGVSENQLGLEWDGLPDHDGIQGDCDEFPFNATYNGSYQYKKGEKKFSVRVINGQQNQDFGSALNKWFNRERILDHDKFFVRFKSAG